MIETAGEHPLLTCVETVRSSLADTVNLDPIFLRTREKESALLALVEVAAAVAALQARLLAASDDVALEHGARDPATWLAGAVHGEYGRVRRSLELGRTLLDLPALAEALARGRIDETKARIIVQALEDLPAQTPRAVMERAEVALVGEAARLSPRELQKAARHLEAVIDPQGAEEAEGKALVREERSAWEKTTLRITSRFDGTHRISGVIPDAAAHRLRTFLQAWTQPRKRPVYDDVRPVRSDQANGRAFCDLLESVNPSRTPDHGGDTTAIVVTIGLTELRRDLGAAALGGIDSDNRTSASEARRLACSAAIIPAILGGKSQVLDLGRSQRLFSPAQRKALRIKHATCQVDDCDVPSTWCEAHHVDPWSHGGRTDLRDALLLCSHHHRRIHDQRFAHVRRGDTVILQLRR